jgi:hypothetical protein
MFHDDWSSHGFSLTVAQFDLLWNCLFDNAVGRERLFKWILTQIRSKDAHAIDASIAAHFIESKVTDYTTLI